MMKLIFASHNEHKVSEVRSILSGLPIDLLSLRDINYFEEIVEDGDTFIENTWIKTNTISQSYDGNVISDDSGLEVMALNGAPGIYSARYAGPHRNGDDNMTKLLSLMQGVTDRRARFISVIAAKIAGEQHTFEGTVDGKIITEKIGAGGFGYDPIFIPDGYDQTFAELSEDVKNQISHRAMAFGALRTFLKSKII